MKLSMVCSHSTWRLSQQHHRVQVSLDYMGESSMRVVCYAIPSSQYSGGRKHDGRKLSDELASGYFKGLFVSIKSRRPQDQTNQMVC